MLLVASLHGLPSVHIFCCLLFYEGLMSACLGLTPASGGMMWQCQKCGQKHIRRVHAKQCKCKKWCTMCSKLVNNVNKHILLSITEGGHSGYRCGTEACTKVFRSAAHLRRHAKACKPCLYCDDVFKSSNMDHMRPDLYIGFDCSRF